MCWVFVLHTRLFGIYLLCWLEIVQSWGRSPCVIHTVSVTCLKDLKVWVINVTASKPVSSSLIKPVNAWQSLSLWPCGKEVGLVNDPSMSHRAKSALFSMGRSCCSFQGVEVNLSDVDVTLGDFYCGLSIYMKYLVSWDFSLKDNFTLTNSG